MTIYDRINMELKKQKKTRKDLCKDTGLSYNTLTSLFQRQSKQMSLNTIQLIAKYLNVSVEYLITGEVKPTVLSEDSIYDSKNTDSMKHELLRIYNDLSIRNRTILLSKAYELEEIEKNNYKSNFSK